MSKSLKHIDGQYEPVKICSFFHRGFVFVTVLSVKSGRFTYFSLWLFLLVFAGREWQRHGRERRKWKLGWLEACRPLAPPSASAAPPIDDKRQHASERASRAEALPRMGDPGRSARGTDVWAEAREVRGVHDEEAQVAHEGLAQGTHVVCSVSYNDPMS